jgi:hypothetical protein
MNPTQGLITKASGAAALLGLVSAVPSGGRSVHVQHRQRDQPDCDCYASGERR